jgi:importin subunit alpha-6/7
LLAANDAKVVIVALEGLENILRMGESQKGAGDFNQMATLIDEAEGVQKIQQLQYHVNEGETMSLSWKMSRPWK